ncbi:MAG: MarR family winged helix-turn-helix transcriptional regulator [Panacagrimonas sp.]
MAPTNKEKKPFRAGFLIHDASRLRRTALDQRLKHLGITRSQWWVLSQVDRDTGEGFSQIELARLLDVGKVTLGGLIDRLEKNGLVMRVPDKEDRRSKRVQLSRKGKNLLHRIEMIGLEVNRQIMEGISEQEEEQLIAILTKMKHNLKAMDAVPVSTTGRKIPEDE